MTLTQLLENVGFFGGAVMACLALLSVFSVGLCWDKYRRFRTAVQESEAFKPAFKKFLHGGDHQELIAAAQKHPNSYVAQVVSAGILEYDGVLQAGRDASGSLELVQSALRDSLSETLIQLKKGLGLLATIGSTAPFIGLLGTVVGIINAFHGIAASGSGGMAAVAGGIGEALVATALGNVPDGAAEGTGVTIGANAAEAVIASRVDDGRGDPSIVYSAQPGIGVWVHTGPMVTAWYGFVDRVAGGRPVAVDGPDPVGSAAYRTDLAEVQADGRTGADVTTYHATAADPPGSLGVTSAHSFRMEARRRM